MSIAELKQKSGIELKQALTDLLRKQFKLRLLLASSELKRNHEIKAVRKDIARVMTLMNQQRLAEERVK